MKHSITRLFLLILCIAVWTLATTAFSQERGIPNRFISYSEFLKLSQEVEGYRQKRRVSEAQFRKLALEKDTLILDTRSKKKYDLLHVKGAVHLNFSDFTKEALEEVIPSRNTRILIYCNNNFEGESVAFPTKSAPTALNISTFVALYAYGYKNVFELGPVLNMENSELEFEGTRRL